MNDYNKDSNIESQQMYDFLKYIMSDVLSRMTLVTESIGDTTSQIKLLSLVTTQPPTRLELLEKINILLQGPNSAEIVERIIEKIDDDVIEILNEYQKNILVNFEKTLSKLEIRDKELIAISQNLTNNKTEIEDLKNKIDNVIKRIDGFIQHVKFLIKVGAILIATTPVIWGIYSWIDKYVLKQSTQ